MKSLSLLLSTLHCPLDGHQWKILQNYLRTDFKTWKYLFVLREKVITKFHDGFHKVLPFSVRLFWTYELHNAPQFWCCVYKQMMFADNCLNVFRRMYYWVRKDLKKHSKKIGIWKKWKNSYWFSRILKMWFSEKILLKFMIEKSWKSVNHNLVILVRTWLTCGKTMQNLTRPIIPDHHFLVQTRQT